MPAEPSISADEFAFLVRRAGLSFGAAQLAEMYAAYAHVERMAANVRRQRPLDTEPAHIFVVANKAG